MMKIVILQIFTAFTIFLTGCAATVPQQSTPVEPESVRYNILLDFDTANDRFSVTMQFDSLTYINNTLQFFPGGSWRGIDFGQMIRNLTAFDANGQISPVQRIGATQWRLLNPAEVTTIRYQIDDTRDLPENLRPPEMLGTALNENYAFVNGGGVFGMLSGMEKSPLQLQINLPDGWQTGTALQPDGSGNFVANSFGNLLTSPILAGYLTEVHDRVMGSDVHMFCYSKTDKIVADHLFPHVRDVITATYHFLNDRLPLEEYTMLFVFEDLFAGGVEYQQSGAFIFEEDDLETIRVDVQDVIAHEYFHLIIPFSIRSDALSIDDFLRSRPTQHLWFFEGVTEWASDIIQLRAGLKDLRHYIVEDFRQKIFRETLFGSETSLSDMSLQSRGNPRDYANVYSRGALVAALLDIHLIDLTDGRRGLQDVINDLILDYGKSRPLPEDQFFEILIDYCGPEFESFIRKYIIGNAPLPYAEMLEKVGINYIESKLSEPAENDFGFFTGADERGVRILWIDDELAKFDVQKDDLLLAIANRRISPKNYQRLLYDELLPRMDIGERYPLQLVRNGKRIQRTAEIVQRKDRHLFSVPGMISPAQQRVREAWLRQLQ